MSKEKQAKCSTVGLKAGDRVSRISYLRVVGKAGRFFTVTNEAGKEWQIDQDLIGAECHAADQFDETKELTRTEVVQEFNKVNNSIFTVAFRRQPKVEDAYEAIANTGKLIPNKEMKKLLKEKMAGEERILIGYVLERDIALGRTMVRDLEQPEDDCIRLVDHRTIDWFIHQNVKYVVKGK